MERLKADAAGLARAAELLRGGAVVAFPTDTVYGLAAVPDQPAALARIYAVKGRPAELPLVLMVDSIEQAARWAQIDERSRQLMDRYWPGPLTLVVPASGAAAPPLTAGEPPTIGVRLPAHAAALALVRAAGGALATTSANRSGLPPALAAEHLLDLEGVAAIVDGGRSPGGRASTVLDVSGDEPRVLRDGPVPRSRLMDWLVGSDG